MNLIESICDYYGAEDETELLQNYRSALMDSVVPCFCTNCGEEVMNGEPDLRGVNCPVCGAGKSVASVVEILMDIM